MSAKFYKFNITDDGQEKLPFLGKEEIEMNIHCLNKEYIEFLDAANSSSKEVAGYIKKTAGHLRFLV